MNFSRRNLLHAMGVGAIGSALRFPDQFILQLRAVQSSKADAVILLNNNENPYGPSEKTITAMHGALSRGNRYPDQQRDDLIQQLASFHRVKAEQVVLGCGSTEILRAAVDAFLSRSNRLLIALPTFEAIADYARAAGAEIVPVPLNRSFAHDLPAMLAKVNKSASLIYICNPNNPTATLTPRGEIEAFLSKLPGSAYVLIDEAYHDFAESSAVYRSFIQQPFDDSRVIVLRTFSKIYGLAGIRLGYGIASPGTANKLRVHLTQDNVSVVAAIAGSAALHDHTAVAAAIKQNADDRQEFFNSAQGRALKPIPSHTNFYMMDITVPAQTAIEHFKKHRILVGRPFPPMDTFLRVSLGRPEEMLEFWRVWDLFGVHPHMHH
jgi:histidinol-phosphate aminotransferase